MSNCFLQVIDFGVILFMKALFLAVIFLFSSINSSEFCDLTDVEGPSDLKEIDEQDEDAIDLVQKNSRNSIFKTYFDFSRFHLINKI